jgi:putative chitinase
MNAEELHLMLPYCTNPGQWASVLSAAMQQYRIDSPDRVACFVAQIGHESAHCNRLTESLNYSAERLMGVFPARFPLLEHAKRFARNEEALANTLYANRLGNGNPQSGDGYRFRGRGLLQITGRNNYAEVGRALDLDLIANPDLLCIPTHAAASAAYFWHAKGLNELADKVQAGDEIFAEITRRINGALGGLTERLALLRRARVALASPTQASARSAHILHYQ